MKKNRVVKLGLGIVMVSLMITSCQGKKTNKSVSNMETSQETTLDTTLLDTESAMLEVESGQEEEDDHERGDTSIIFYASELEDKYWSNIERGIEKAKGELNLKNLQVIREQNDFDEVLLDEMGKESRGFSFYLKDPQSKIEVLQDAYKSGVPIIGIRLEVNDEIRNVLAAHATPDSYAMGQLAATNTYAKLKDKISGVGEEEVLRLGVICENPDNPTIDARTQGYIDKMADLLGFSKTSVEGYEKYNREVETSKYMIEVVAPTVLGEFDPEAMRPKINELLNKQDLITVFATSQVASECMLETNQEISRLSAEGILGVGFDSGAVQMQAIREGVLSGAVAINYEQLGYKAITMAVTGALGHPLQDVDTGEIWYDAKNIDSDELTAYLYE
ncbi:MAG TPA: substrate-binding domain-containing protein [Candidatus Merdenecus merdavium]|nr:substrate-binding domain-containing protein [Candidatus Merdenecus merdavium]